MGNWERHYKVGGLVFGLDIASPYSAMEYTQPVLDRIRLASEGVLYPVLPTRAGDDVPPRTLVQSREELPESFSKLSIDLSQYEPFATGDSSDEVFHLSVCTPAETFDSEGERLIINVDDNLPNYTISERGGNTIFRFRSSTGADFGVLRLDAEASRGEFIPLLSEGKTPGGKSVGFYVNMSLMIMYTYNASRFNALLIHSSVISHRGEANLFLGKSGTGKSTHSRLWLDHIEGAELLNDDNPVLRMHDGELWVYGSPWSGKTPCYRNASRKVRAIVNLRQAPHNSAQRIKGISAYSLLLSSISSVRWSRPVMDKITSTLSDIAMNVPCFIMDCLPDVEAARTCLKAIENE